MAASNQTKEFILKSWNGWGSKVWIGGPAQELRTGRVEQSIRGSGVWTPNCSSVRFPHLLANPRRIYLQVFKCQGWGTSSERIVLRCGDWESTSLGRPSTTASGNTTKTPSTVMQPQPVSFLLLKNQMYAKIVKYSSQLNHNPLNIIFF